MVDASVVVVTAVVVDSVVIGVVEPSVTVVASVVPFAQGGACVDGDVVQFLFGCTLSAWLQVSMLGSQIVPFGHSK